MSKKHEILEHEEYSHLHIDSDDLMKALGMDINGGRFIDLHQINAQELSELAMKSVMWMERLSRILALVEKTRLDEELARDVIVNRGITGSSETRVSAAKAGAKSDTKYISAEKRLNMIVSWKDYIARLMNILDKYHYVVKDRLKVEDQVEKKY